MNSLNILSARVSPPQTPSPSRTNSFGSALALASSKDGRLASIDDANNDYAEDDDVPTDLPAVWSADSQPDEKTPLLHDDYTDVSGPSSSGWSLFHSRIARAFISSLRLVFSTLAAPGVYLLACLYDEKGNFAPLHYIGVVWPGTSVDSEKSVASSNTENSRCRKNETPSRRNSAKTRRVIASNSSSSGLSSESEPERDPSINGKDNERKSTSRHTRSKSSDEITPARRSIRIKLHNEDSLRQRKHRKTKSTSSQSNGAGAVSAAELTAANLKSPTSPTSSLSLTKYPRAPAPPRPLIPQRLPSYSHIDISNGRMAQKTLILDLDETLIHSMAKGGRMSTGHMVEVKLNTYVGVGGQTNVGPQHPILYYVHKRPHCDDFLRRVCVFRWRLRWDLLMTA